MYLYSYITLIIFHLSESDSEFPILTVCLRSSDPLNVVTYYIKLVTTSWAEFLRGLSIFKAG